MQAPLQWSLPHRVPVGGGHGFSSLSASYDYEDSFDGPSESIQAATPLADSSSPTTLVSRLARGTIHPNKSGYDIAVPGPDIGPTIHVDENGRLPGLFGHYYDHEYHHHKQHHKGYRPDITGNMETAVPNPGHTASQPASHHDQDHHHPAQDAADNVDSACSRRWPA